MLLLFLLLSSLLSISKDKIKQVLNITVGVCVVYPDGSTFDISKKKIFESLTNLIIGRFSFSSYSYSQYSLSDKSTLIQNSDNIIITREGKFLEHYLGNLSIISIADEINQAFFSFVEILNETTLESFKEDTVSLFLLTGTLISREFDDAAFFYRKTKARFGFIYRNQTEEFLSLCYIKNKNNVTRYYDGSIPIIQFIRSCKIEKYPNNISPSMQNTIRYPDHYMQFVAITDNFTEEIQSAFDYINSSRYGNAIDFDVVSWNNITDLKKACQIQKPESNLTFVLIPKRRKRYYSDCYVFQDMDFYSKELLFFFVSKTIKGLRYSIDPLKHDNDNSRSSRINPFLSRVMMSSSPMTLDQSTFSNYIPGRNLALVFIQCPNSFSQIEANLIFNSLSHEFEEMRINGQLNNNQYINPVDFYKIDYDLDSFKLPSADSFPTFVIFKPNNKLAYVFNDILTIENLRNWILNFALEEEQNSNIPKTSSNSPLSASENEKEAGESSLSDRLKLLLSSLGLDFGDTSNVEIISNVDVLDDGADSNEGTTDSHMSKEEIEKLVKIEVKKIFNQEKDQMKKEITREVIENIKDRTKGEVIRNNGEEKDTEKIELDGDKKHIEKEYVNLNAQEKEIKEEKKIVTIEKEIIHVTLDEDDKSPTLEEEQKSSTLEEEQRSATLEEEQKSSTLEEEQKSATLEEDKKPATLEEEQKSATLEEEQKSATLEEEQKSATLEEEQKSYTLEEEQRSYTLEEEQKSSTLEEEQKSATLEEEQKSSTLEEEQRSSTLEEEQKSSTLEEEQRSSTLEEEQKSATLEEEQKSSTLEEEQRSSTLEEEQKSATLEEEQRSSTLEEEQKSSTLEEEQKSSTLEEEQRSSTLEEEQKSAILEEEQKSATLSENNELTDKQTNALNQNENNEQKVPEKDPITEIKNIVEVDSTEKVTRSNEPIQKIDNHDYDSFEESEENEL